METLGPFGKRNTLIAIGVLTLLIVIVIFLVMQGQAPYIANVGGTPPPLAPLLRVADVESDERTQYEDEAEEWNRTYATLLPELYEDLVAVYNTPTIINDYEWLDRHFNTMNMLMTVGIDIQETTPPERFFEQHHLLSNGAKQVIISINRYADVKSRTGKMPLEAFEDLNKGILLLNEGFQGILPLAEEEMP